MHVSEVETVHSFDNRAQMFIEQLFMAAKPEERPPMKRMRQISTGLMGVLRRVYMVTGRCMEEEMAQTAVSRLAETVLQPPCNNKRGRS